MKNTVVILIILSFLSVVHCSNGDKPGNNQDVSQGQIGIRFISAENGLRMRDAPTLDGEITGAIPFNTEVKLMEQTGEETTIAGATGKWCKVDWDGKTGWVFGGFLSETKMQIDEEIAFETDSLIDEIIGKTFQYVDEEIGGFLEFTIGYDGYFHAESVEPGQETIVEGNYEFVPSGNNITLLISGTAHRHAVGAEAEEEYYEEFTEAQLILSPFAGGYIGSLDIPGCIIQEVELTLLNSE